jgi:hypothetical protein
MDTMVPWFGPHPSHFHWAKSSEYVTQVTAIRPLGPEYISANHDPRNRNPQEPCERFPRRFTRFAPDGKLAGRNFSNEASVAFRTSELPRTPHGTTRHGDRSEERTPGGR